MTWWGSLVRIQSRLPILLPEFTSFVPLPPLTPGQRYAWPRPAGSADALQLAQIARREYASGQRMLLIVCADPRDAQRLKDEIPFFAPELLCVLFPDWETLPYDQFSPHHDLISERLASLWRISNGQANLVLIPATTALYRLPPPEFLARYTFHFKAKQQLDVAQLRAQLTQASYQLVSQVLSPGEYAIRGNLIDLFPMGSSQPYRLDLWDQEIDSIRSFSTDTQRSLDSVLELKLLPGREFPMDEAGQQTFRQRWQHLFDQDPCHTRIFKDMGHGIATAGIEYYLPLFFEKTATVFDYLGDRARLVLHGELETAMSSFWQDTQERFRLAQADPERKVLPPAQLFLTTEQFYTHAKPLAQFSLRPTKPEPDIQIGPGAWTEAWVNVHAVRASEDPLLHLKNQLKQHSRRVLILAESEGRRQSLRDFFSQHGLTMPMVDSLAEFLAGSDHIALACGPLQTGFVMPEAGLAWLTEAELFADFPTLRRHKKQEQYSDVAALLKDLSELKPGDPVVHGRHGIGRYRGLVNLDFDQDTAGVQHTQEFLHLEYAQQAVLYVPISQLHLISRYSGVNSEQAPLHRLGSDQWDKALKKAAHMVRDTAAELLNLYARRHARQGHAFRFHAEDYATFANDFGFEETADQSAAIKAIIEDLRSPKPMDRLVCGDVGFGKTEVALRAAFIAVMGGKQVALLTPTTLLAEQHYQTMRDRFSKWPVQITELSRFRTGREIKAALQGLSDGSIDIVVGTHKIFSASVQFKHLGLLIIDEEHRFGVRHKEKLKELRAEVDVLTLTATPIPRTLGMALEGLRDLSVIATAPQRRLAIKTFVRSQDNSVVREAVLREINRGGQCYYLHNEVASIEERKAQLQQIVPEAHIAIAHGQMSERDLERVMRDFIAQRFNVLLCSTIIETGIDVATANTILISRADKFGLSQLHQLRGRVGRSHHQAYAYLMVPDTEVLTPQAKLRLEAIQSMEKLGSGFYLAMHDLEIRGAGEILGENQSGDMLEVGFELYNDMLTEAVNAIKSGREPDLTAPLQATTEINLHAPALLPEVYCEDVQLRLSFYKKLASSQSLPQIDRVQEEIVDRFGQPPSACQTLLDVHRLRVLSHPLGITRVDASADKIQINFRPDAPVAIDRIIELVQQNKHIKLAGNDKLHIAMVSSDLKQRVQMLHHVLRQIGPPALKHPK